MALGTPRRQWFPGAHVGGSEWRIGFAENVVSLRTLEPGAQASNPRASRLGGDIVRITPGKPAAESEACILRAIRGWRLPASDRGAGTYSFPFSFTK